MTGIAPGSRGAQSGSCRAMGEWHDAVGVGHDRDKHLRPSARIRGQTPRKPLPLHQPPLPPIHPPAPASRPPRMLPQTKAFCCAKAINRHFIHGPSCSPAMAVGSRCTQAINLDSCCDNDEPKRDSCLAPRLAGLTSFGVAGVRKQRFPGEPIDQIAVRFPRQHKERPAPKIVVDNDC